MAIRPIDVQVNVTGSNQVSETRHKQQLMEQLHQQNPQGATAEIERKLTKSVNEVRPDMDVDPEGHNQQEAERRKQEAQKKQDEENKAKNAKPVSDGIRGKRVDFSV